MGAPPHLGCAGPTVSDSCSSGICVPLNPVKSDLVTVPQQFVEMGRTAVVHDGRRVSRTRPLHLAGAQGKSAG